MLANNNISSDDRNKDLVNEINKVISGSFVTGSSALPEIFEQSANEAAKLLRISLILEDRRNILESHFNKAMNAYDGDVSPEDLLQVFNSRVEELLAESLAETRANRPNRITRVRVRLGDAITTLHDLSEGQTIVIQNVHSGKKRLAIVEGIDGARGFWIKQLVVNKKEKTLVECTASSPDSSSEPEYVPGIDVRYAQTRLFFAVKNVDI